MVFATLLSISVSGSVLPWRGGPAGCGISILTGPVSQDAAKGGPMGRQAQLVCAWCGPALVVIALGGMTLAGIIPIPPSANATLDETVAFYTHNPNLVRFGLMLASVGVSLIGPLLALITVQMLRMERGRPPILSVLQVISGAVTWVLLMVPMIMLNVAAFRPERSPELTQTLSDLAWILFFTPVAPFLIQNVAIGAAVLGDRNPVPVLPRWVGYGNFWTGLLFVPALLAYFFKSGPFAWQGIFVFYLGTAVYGAWVLVMSLMLRRAVLAEPADCYDVAPLEAA